MSELVTITQNQVTASQAAVDSSKAAQATALDNYNALVKARQDAYSVYIAATKANGTGNAQAEYAAYKTAQSAATDAQAAYQEATATYESNVNTLEDDQARLAQYQQIDAEAASQPAATANTNTSNDTSSTAAQSTPASNASNAGGSTPASSQTAQSSDATATGSSNGTDTGSTASTTNTSTPTSTTTTAASTSTQTNTTTQGNSPDDTGAVQLSAQEQAKLKSLQDQLTAVQTVQSYTATNKQLTADQKSQLTQQYAAQAADISKQIAAIQVGGHKAKVVDPTPNPLDAYSSYTYGFTLHILTAQDYNNMVKDPTNFKPSVTLISTGGRYSDSGIQSVGTRAWRNVGRDPAFKQDFYFDDIKFETVVGLNANSRGTNAITMEFTIIEPYGMTLLDRIMDVNNAKLNGKNYLEMPYLLELSFFGADDDGQMQKIANQTKWFPIKIIGFKIKAGVKGAEYQVQAVPFNHSANFETVQSIKTRMEITATTVGDYFSTDLTNADGVNNQIDAEIKRRKQPPPPPAQNRTGEASGSQSYTQEQSARKPDKASDSNSSDQAPVIINANSFVAAYNAWYKKEEENGNIGKADVIEFVFHEDLNMKEISSAKIVDEKKASTRRVGETDTNTKSKSESGKDTKQVNFDSIVHDLEAGTTINEVVNIVLPQSEYFLKQAVDSNTSSKISDKGQTQDATQGSPVKMWKIVPSIELLDFDNKRNVFAKKMTFNVSSYLAYQKRDDRLPQSPPPKEVKRYDYLYTGHNNSVLSFDIDFNALYFTAINVDRGSTTAGSGASQKPEDSTNTDKTGNSNDKQQIGPDQKQSISGDYTSGSGGAVQRSETQNARSSVESMYTSAQGDMITLKMTIIGDPEFIKQDDLFISPAIANGAGTGVIKDGNSIYVPGTKSVDMDSGEIYGYVTFRTPTDFDDETGMYDLNSKNKYQVSEFSGYYRIITVKNEFKGGKFTQTLDMVRYPKQDPINASAASNQDTKSAGETQRENPSAKDLKDKQLTGNPQVKPNNVDSTPNPQNVDPTIAQQSASAVVAGPDNDAAVQSAPPTAIQTNGSVLTAITNGTVTQSAPTADVANGSQTVAIGDQPPATNTSGAVTTGSDNGSTTGSEPTSTNTSTTASTSATSSSTAAANTTTQTSSGSQSTGGGTTPDSSSVNTGDPQIGGTSSNNPNAQAQQTIADARSQISALYSQNTALQSQATALRTQNQSLNAQADALDAIVDPTPEQKAQLKALENQINQNSTQINQLVAQQNANADQVNQIANTANNATFGKWADSNGPINVDIQTINGIKFITYS